MTAFEIVSPNAASALAFSCRRMIAEISWGVKVFSPSFTWMTESLSSAMWKGKSFSSS